MKTVLAVPLLALAMAAAQAPRAELAPAKVARIGQVMTAFMARNKVPGLSVAVVADGEMAWSDGYGLADVENQVPAKATTVYRTASIGKTMTATAAMFLVEERKLSLDDEVQKYCPAFPRKDYRLTSRHLLSHLGGVRHYGGPRDEEEQSSNVHYANVVDALAPFKDDPLLFRPGTKFLYSTYGYNVLGCVIQGAAGVPFLEYMKRAVWDRAGMSSTRDDDPAAIIPNRAAGYAIVGGELRNARKIDMSSKMPAGGYVTTVGDLAKFSIALMQGRLVRPETFRLMTTPTALDDGTKVPFGIGWPLELEEWHSDNWISHGGSTPGVSGMLALMPRHRFAVAILANVEELPDRSELAADVARIALGLGEPVTSKAP